MLFLFFLGVETTHCLLSAILLETNENAHVLALSAAINRFLNLISHAGMNMFNLTKYYDVARHLAIPRYVFKNVEIIFSPSFLVTFGDMSFHDSFEMAMKSYTN